MYDFKPNIKDENELIVSSEMSLKNDKLLLSNEKKEIEFQIGDINSEIKDLGYLTGRSPIRPVPLDRVLGDFDYEKITKVEAAPL